VSRFEPNKALIAAYDDKEGKIRFSPVYAGHSIKPLKKLDVSSLAPAVSDRIGLLRQAGTALPHSGQNDRVVFLSSNPCGCPERNDLLP
jgi:hypothetical protein